LATPEIYVPLAQSPMGSMLFAVRIADGDPAAIAPAIRDAVRRLDPELPVSGIQSMDARVGQSLRVRRFRTAILALFAGLAALLACTGVYAVRARAVAARRREIGIRMALGATRGRVMALAIGQGVRLTAIGVAIGAAAALPAARAVESWLFDTAPSDPAVLAGSALLLGGAAMLASWGPALRAARQDPLVVLRDE
jgi:ABC-type antimicrobial peptide transport system permease subunit